MACTDTDREALYVVKLRDLVDEEHIKQLISEGEGFEPELLFAAVFWRRPEAVDLLLSAAGADPNRRHARAEDVMPLAEQDWYDRDPDRLFDRISKPSAAWSGRYYAMARIRMPSSPPSCAAADSPRSIAPCFQAKESTTRQTRATSSLGTMASAASSMPSWKPASSPSSPFLESPEFMDGLDLEHRDPLGRTLFLSACRSKIGADALLDKMLFRHHHDVDPSFRYDEDPRAAFPPGIYHSEPRADGHQLLEAHGSERSRTAGDRAVTAPSGGAVPVPAQPA
ncbi:hypothetical protein V8C26DRAFT_332644 [Trichoderma gracile]